MSVRLALADDQALVRHGLRAVLEEAPDIEVVVEAADGAALLAALQETRVDVVLSDVRMPGMDGLALARRLQADGGPPVVLLTTFADEAVESEVLAAGAGGFLLKDASPEELCDAVRCVARGERWLQPVATAPLQDRVSFAAAVMTSEAFSDRELSILRLMAAGYSNREIARAVFLAEGTVKNYVSEILAKLETRDRTRAVLKAIKLRLI